MQTNASLISETNTNVHFYDSLDPRDLWVCVLTKTCIQEESYTDFPVTLLTQQVMDYMTGSALSGVRTAVC